MRISVNVATRPFVNRVPHVVLLASLLVAALGLTAWNFSLWLRTRSETRAVETELAALASEEARIAARRGRLEAQLAGADLVELEGRVEAANQVLLEKALSWTLLLDRLEEHVPYDAAVKAVRTSVGPGLVSLDVNLRARNEEYYLLSLEELEKSDCFANVYPSSDLAAAQGEVEATLSMDYDPSCGTAAPAGPKKSRKAVRPKTRTRGGARG